MLSHAERTVLDQIDDAAMVATAEQLIMVPSVGGTDAESDIQADMARRLTEVGLDVDHWQLDLAALRAHPDYPGEEVDRTESWGVVARSGEDDHAPALILQGHVDVVPAGKLDTWSTAPYTPTMINTAHGTALVGRGSCDMKAGVAAILAATQAIQRSGIVLERPYAVHSVIGEEDGGLGAFATVQRGHLGDACLIPEPTRLDLVTANAGALTFRIEVPGLATHGSTAYAGSSAITSYMAIHAALAELERRRNANTEALMREYPVAYPLSVGKINSGEWASSVPDLLIAEGRLGLRIEEDPAIGRTELEECVAAVAAKDPYLRDHPPVVTWPGGQFRGGHLPSGHVLRDLVSGAHTDLAPAGSSATPPVEHGAPYGSDLRLYAGAGIATLHYGPGDVRYAHGPDEQVLIDEMIMTARVLALAVLRSCGVKG